MAATPPEPTRPPEPEWPTEPGVRSSTPPFPDTPESVPAEPPIAAEPAPPPTAPVAHPGGFEGPAEYQQLPGEYQQPAGGYPQPAGEHLPSGEYEQPTVGQEAEGQEPLYPPPPVPAQPDAAGPYAVSGSVGIGGGDDKHDGGRGDRRAHFRADIEGLRAVAILAVLLFHVGVPFADGGFTGVDVFYVISGFLITGLLIREGEQSGKVDLIRFYARRLRRLLPAALLVIVVTLVLSAIIVKPLRLSEIAGDAAAAALYVANFRFGLEATDYLAVEAPSPLLHYWSLGVEEQFYLVWPLLLLVATRFLSLRWVGAFLLVLAIGSFGLSVYWTETLPEWAFFSPFTRAWELAAGALIAVGFLRIPKRLPSFVGGVAMLLGLALIVVGVVLISDEMPFPGLVALVPVVGATLVIVGGVNGPTLPGRIILGNPLSRYFGRISYSLYLWHWPLLILVPLAVETELDDVTFRLLLAGVAVVLAAISTELVERPFRRSAALDRRPRGSLQLGLTGSVAVGVAALFMSGAITLPSNFSVPALQPDPVVVQLAGVREDLPTPFADECHISDWRVKKLQRDCVYGDPEGEQTAMLIGDSHAVMWQPALDQYAREQGWRLELHTKGGCPVIDVPVFKRDISRVYEACTEWRERLAKHIRKSQPDVIFMGLSRDYELWSGEQVIQSSAARTYWQERLTEWLGMLADNAGRVILLAETPTFNYDPVNCLSKPDNNGCDGAAFRVLDSAYAELERAATRATGVELFSINELLCPGATCPVVVDEMPVFRDEDHVTASYMERLAAPIGRMLEGKSPYPSPSPAPSPAAAS